MRPVIAACVSALFPLAQALASPPVAPRVACSALVQDGARRDPAVRDFQEIPGAPTRVTSATVVAATETQPEHCLVAGYVQPQVKFELKLPTSTWQGRYLQFGCAGYCGTISRTAFPSCRAELDGDFAIAATNDVTAARHLVAAGGKGTVGCAVVTPACARAGKRGSTPSSRGRPQASAPRARDAAAP
jgi:feruloyl esterase